MKSSSHITIAGIQLWVEQLHYTEEVNRPTLIFLHEALGSVALWKAYPGLLCEALECNGVVYDRMGHGLSSPFNKARDNDYLELEAVLYLRELILELGLQQPILIGHSDGGTIALIYAAKYPDEVSGIITEAAHIYVEDSGSGGMKQAIHQFEHTIFKEKLAKYHGEKTEDLFYAWADTWTSAAFSTWNIADQLSGISCPALILQGSQDEYATQQHLWDIANGIGENAKGVLIENCGHNPHLQAQAETLALSRDFIHNLL
ncbi:MAG: alpha/beta hydrolase [Saprospiraceae bacterium]|nr:alpha/beta hydrolase [Saprospiraceae bacterium]